MKTIEELISNQSKNGSFDKSKTSITRSSGKSLIIETTSLALLSMLKVDPTMWQTQIKKGVKYLIREMNKGFFRSTQATVLAMKALIEVMKISNQSSKEMEFDVIVQNKPHIMLIGDSMRYPKKGNLS